MARQTNAAYWAQRMKNMEDALLDQSYSCLLYTSDAADD